MIWGNSYNARDKTFQVILKCNFGASYLGNNNGIIIIFYRIEDLNVYFMEIYRKMRTPTQIMPYKVVSSSTGL